MAKARRSSLFQTLTLVFAWLHSSVMVRATLGDFGGPFGVAEHTDLQLLRGRFVGSVGIEENLTSGENAIELTRSSDGSSSKKDKSSKSKSKNPKPDATPATPKDATPATPVDVPNNGVSPVTSNGGSVFDVIKYGAKADGKTDNAQAFMKAWIAACKTAASSAKVVVPVGTFVVGPVVFAGPCLVSGRITVEVQGTIKATTDISEYSSSEWISFESINGLVLTGKGVFDGQGAEAWAYNDCKQNSECQTLPISIKFTKLNHTLVEGITSLNSKGFHTSVYGCYNFTAQNLHVTAPGESPNTDGMHVSTSKLVTITNSIIGTGDDCISIGQGNENVIVTAITCGPGHGISIGSLGKYPNEKSVRGVLVKNCTLTGTTNGARIKTWAGPIAGTASDIVYEDIVMNNVKNPIIIDQTYGTNQNKASKWKISDVHFRNIRGTSATNVAVALECSSLFPCEGIELKDINLAISSVVGLKTNTIGSSCSNAKISILGIQIPPVCN